MTDSDVIFFYLTCVGIGIFVAGLILGAASLALWQWFT